MNFTPCYQAGRGARTLEVSRVAWTNVNGLAPR